MIIYKVSKGDEIVYIGQTTMRLSERKGCHLHQARKGRGALLGAAIRKHGEESFVWSVVCQADSLIEACALEKKYIAKHLPRYNQQEGGKSGWTAHNKGVKASKEAIAKLKESCKTRVMPKRGEYSDEHKSKMSQGLKKAFANPFVSIENGKTYSNKVDAARDLNISPVGISLVLMPSTRNKTYKGYTFKYVSALDKFSLIDLEA